MWSIFDQTRFIFIITLQKKKPTPVLPSGYYPHSETRNRPLCFLISNSVHVKLHHTHDAETRLSSGLKSEAHLSEQSPIKLDDIGTVATPHNHI